MKYAAPIVNGNPVAPTSVSCNAPIKYTCNSVFKCSGSFVCDDNYFTCKKTWNV